MGWLSSRIADLAVEEVLTQHELQEAFNGTTKIKNTPIPAPMEHLCAVLTNLYVITAPFAIATAFKNGSGKPVRCVLNFLSECVLEAKVGVKNATINECDCVLETCSNLKFLGRADH